MKEERAKLYDLIDSRDPEAIYAEIRTILSLLNADIVSEPLRAVYDDVVRLFNGNYPGYQASNTKYHNLEHTTMVALATVRLIHGCAVAGQASDPEKILLGLMASLFHDSGLIQTEHDVKGTGAKYTIGHEERSVAFMAGYLSSAGWSGQQIIDCGHLIKCTNLSLEIGKIPFRSKEVARFGKIVGSADLLAQMADRHYLEKLLLLFKEFEEAGIPEFDSEEQLLRKTEGFYKQVARKRLIVDYDNVAACMRHHFEARWQIDQDLYSESIEHNIDYLREIFSDGANSRKDRFYRFLKRGGIVEEIRALQRVKSRKNG